MILIVGLGNPGIKYKYTRHNLGFCVVDKFQKTTSFPKFKLVQKFNSLISQDEIQRKKIILAKPQTFMNTSGQAVKALIENCKLKIENLVVVHDDLDLPLGKIRISQARGSAGHKGVESIIKELRTKDFTRIRIGIRQKSNIKNQISKIQIKNQKLDKFVLERFTKEEEEIIKEVIKKSCQALKIALTEGIEKAMAEFNK